MRKKVFILLVILTILYHDARFGECKAVTSLATMEDFFQNKKNIHNFLR